MDQVQRNGRARLELAFRTEDFDALVVAVIGAPAEIEMAERAALHPKNDHRRIDVAMLRESRFDQAISDRINLDRTLARYPAGEIEKMGALVAQHPARILDVVEVRKRLSARREMHHLDPSDFAVRDRVLQSRMLEIVAPVEAHSRNHAAFAGKTQGLNCRI